MSNNELTERQEKFARLCVELGNQAAAYRRAYKVCERTLPATVWEQASRLANNRTVAARIRELRDEAAAQTTINTAARMQWLHDIETADPNEIVSVVLRNCRYCRGVDHRYQWKDADEFTLACVTAIDCNEPSPSDAGGYGFNGALEPVLTCSECHGDGVRMPVIADTTKLTGKARKLYKGARVKSDGSIEILLHDQLVARDQLNRLLGLYKDDAASVARGAAAGAAAGAAIAQAAAARVEEMSEDKARRLYLELVS